MDENSKINDNSDFFSAVLQRFHPKSGDKTRVKNVVYITIFSWIISRARDLFRKGTPIPYLRPALPLSHAF